VSGFHSIAPTEGDGRERAVAAQHGAVLATGDRREQHRGEREIERRLSPGAAS
jgi:hypothetical protein